LEADSCSHQFTSSRQPTGGGGKPAGLTPDARRILEVIDRLPEEEREAVDLVRSQSLWSVEAARILNVQGTPVNRGLHRSLQLLAEVPGGLSPNENVSCSN
jgi:DNA-directed RNA polymerase specialized sigma24 family protein